MKNLVLRIYDWMSGHRWWCLASLAVVTLLMVLSVTRLSYREDIRDFLPLDEKERAALNDYDRQAQTCLIVAIIEQRDSTVDDPDLLVEGVETFLDAIEGLEGVTVQTDFSQMEEQQEEAYRQLPYLLEAADYQRMDSLLRQPEFMASRLQEAKERLLMPMGMGSMVEDEIIHDPLGLFSPVVSLMRDTAMLSRFDIYDGCLLTADHRRALVMLNSPYGGSETASNEQLLEVLKVKADSILLPLTSHLSPLNIRFCGAPVVAVTNASQIKTDSLLSVCIAAVLILLLLWFFLRSLRHILLIALTIGWGWVFAIACLSWVHQEVSVIVIGISSIIVGIAVNYPLHLIAHLSHTSDVRQALQEIVKPLVVGNITTVGAFLALVPLRAAALRDLGLFSSFLLIGTILFTLIWLPQMVCYSRKEERGRRNEDTPAADSVSDISPSSFLFPPSSKKFHKVLPIILLLLTAFFGYHSLHTAFDADLTHINYMTPVQRADMALLQQLMPTDSQRQQELNRRIPTTPEAQQQRLQLWQLWTSSHRDQLSLSLRDEATKAGFTPDSFDPFFALLISRNEEGGARPLVACYRRDARMRNEKCLRQNQQQEYPPSSFLLPPSSNSSSLFSSIASHLSDDFNYIGWACACIVFFFLWASFRSLPLALLSFLPMAVSWLWILGIMALLGIQFNIINIILSTFIFGQGDDYTIFMTEGTVYEYKHHRPMLASYRRAIMLSALIMFIGIGSLIIARHPALHSLAEVTIVGMFSVVLMAFVIPPMVFRLWLRFSKKIR